MPMLPVLLALLAQVAPQAQVPEALRVLQLQVMLDRSGFSPGALDGRMGAGTERALEAFRKDGRNAWAVVPTRAYRITPEDAAGPFVDLPADMGKQAELPALGYGSLVEALAERFHCAPRLLKSLNPAARFEAGEELQVPNVNAMPGPALPPVPPDPSAPPAPTAREMVRARPAVVVTLARRTSSLTVTGEDGHTVFFAPVTTGSRHDPLPLGVWKVNGLTYQPTYSFDPRLFWNRRRKDAKALLPAGPNNPVGLVWIDLSKAHYGLHGTPDPEAIGRTQSHGCVRLTNWDALWLASLVQPGTRVLFEE